MQFNLIPSRTFESEFARRCEEDWDKTVDLDVFDGMEAQLTWDHINAGERNHRRNCPIGLCLREMMETHKDKIGKPVWVEVNLLSVCIFTEGRDKAILVIEQSGLLQEWLDDYNAMRKVPRGSIYIEKDGFIEGLNKVSDKLTPPEAQPVRNSGEKVQHWICGIDIEGCYHDA